MDERGPDEARIVAEIAGEIHRFVQRFPNHYAARALATLVNRAVAGERVGRDERELVILTLAREAKQSAGSERFGRPGRSNDPAHRVDENA